MFIDTNVLVYSRAVESPNHHAARAKLKWASHQPEPLRISRQVVREYLAVVTRPQPWPFSITREDALNDAQRLVNTFQVLEDGPIVTETLITLCREVVVAGKHIHDANIVATMLTYGERRILTFNTTDFRRYGDRIELVALDI